MAEERNIFEVLTDYSVNERMNKVLLENEQYQEVQGKIDDQIELFNRLNLNKEQRRVVDGLVSLHTESGALYGRLTYQQGCKDCVTLLKAVGVIKAS